MIFVKFVNVYVFCTLCIFSLCNSTDPDDNALVWVDVENDDENSNLNTENISPSLSDEVFLPTNEWQEVKPDQVIPRGLHVRLNLETGKREAKLIADGENSKKFQYWDDGSRKGMINNEKNVFTHNELKRALKQFEKETEQEKAEINNEDDIKSKFRSYEELKQDLADINMQIKTDTEIIIDLTNEFRSANCSLERKLTILTDLEYLVHQIDNARNFVDLEGLSIVKQTLNSSELKFRELGAFLTGSACQSNPKVQIAAVENGILHQILRLFTSEKDVGVRRKFLYAVSSLLRHFPFAQKKFLDLGGIEMFEQVLRRNTDEKEKYKVITLIYDLLNERRDIESQANSRNKAILIKLDQYREFSLMDVLIDREFCIDFAKSLSKSITLDEQERVLNVLEITADRCRRTYKSIESDLNRLSNEYKQSASIGDIENDYILSLIDLIDNILTKSKLKDEL